jgi:magnesium-transporting ATPase (P-type)
MRAVQASDFSIGEFRFLRKLLFFHGRHNYIRISEMIMYFFYKNFVFTINQLYYGFFNNFSGQTIFDDWFITFFNTTITATPLLARALFDQDLTTEDGELIQNLLPLIYAEARDNPIFTINNFFFNILRGTIHGILNFMIVYYSINLSTVDIKGNTADLWYFSTNLFTNIVYVKIS